MEPKKFDLAGNDISVSLEERDRVLRDILKRLARVIELPNDERGLAAVRKNIVSIHADGVNSQISAIARERRDLVPLEGIVTPPAYSSNSFGTGGLTVENEVKPRPYDLSKLELVSFCEAASWGEIIDAPSWNGIITENILHRVAIEVSACGTWWLAEILKLAYSQGMDLNHLLWGGVRIFFPGTILKKGSASLIVCLSNWKDPYSVAIQYPFKYQTDDHFLREKAGD